MATIAEKYEFKLYIEGVKTNYSTVNISTNSEGATAMIEIPANTTLKNIGPRTRVHVFFKKYSDDDWLLLFDGEVYGFQLSKGANYNSFMLTCRDISGYLEIMYTYFYGNTNIAEIGTKIVQLHGAARDTTDLITRGVGVNRRDQLLKKANSHLGILHGLIDGIITAGGREGEGVNQFFMDLERYRKFKDRFYGMADSELENILKLEDAKRLMSRNAYQGLNNVRALLADVMSTFYYETSYLSSPNFNGGDIRQIIFKPDNYFVPAPLCNVIFQNMISSVNFSRNFMAEPTRMAVIGDNGVVETEGALDILTTMAYSPWETSQLNDRNVLHYGVLPQETNKGIIPAIRRVLASIQNHGVNFNNMQKREPGDGEVALRYASSYLLSKEQTQNRTLTVNECIFNPYMAVNFPGVVVVEPYIFMGVIKSVDHRISSQGTVSTSFNMSYCRIADVELDTETKIAVDKLKKTTAFDWSSLDITHNQVLLARLLGDIEQPYPSWLNVNYRPNNIDNTYSNLLGCKSVINGGSGNTISQTDAIRTLHSSYSNYKAREATKIFTDSICARPIITEKQFFEKFLGLTKRNDMYNSGGFFNKDYQSMVVKYNNKVNFNVGHIS